MRSVLMFVSMTALVAQAQVPPAPRSPIRGAPDVTLPYAFETSDLGFIDLLTLTDGSKRTGKVLEWADQILLYRGGPEPEVFALRDVQSFQPRRSFRHLRRPPLADLTVAWIERGSAPDKGGAVALRIHVLNAGGVESAAATCRVLVDGKEIAHAPVAPLAPDKEAVVEATWARAEGARVLRAEVRADAAAPEIESWNNALEEAADGIGVTVLVSRDLRQRFRGVRNLVDSFCIENWIQYHFDVLNGLFAASVYPSSPHGIVERVHCARVVAFDGGVEDYLLGAGSDGKSAQEAGPTVALDAVLRGQELVEAAVQVDWTLLQGIASRLGLVDLHAGDTALEDCLVKDHNERYVQRRNLFPWPKTMMYTAGGFPFTEVEAAYLNRVRGHARGPAGEYLLDTPEKMVLEVRSNTGRPLSATQVDVFARDATGSIAGEPLLSGQTDAAGRLELPNRDATGAKTAGGFEPRANSFGQIAPNGSNGLLLVRVKTGEYEEYHFVRLFDALVGALRGQRAPYVQPINTHVADADAPPAPPYTAGLRRRPTTTAPAEPDAGKAPYYVKWNFPEAFRPLLVDEFQVYRRTGYAGDDTHPWMLDGLSRRAMPFWKTEAAARCFVADDPNDLHSLDTFYAVCTVDTQGRQSGPAPFPAFFPHRADVQKMAINPDHEIYMTAVDCDPAEMLIWTSNAGTQPYGTRHRKFPGYAAAYGGVAIGLDRRVIVSDPVNHVLAFYDHGDLTDLVPAPGTGASRQDGQFDTPLDIAVDGQGRLYVADTGNDRVQILDQNGVFLDMLDRLRGLEGPSAIAIANGHLCVTDRGASRCRVYDVTASPPKFERELNGLVDADRALVGKSGRVYVAARSPTSAAEWGILLYEPDGEKAKLRDVITTAEGQTGEIDRPRGFCFFETAEKQYGYFVNDRPFNVRRTPLE